MKNASHRQLATILLALVILIGIALATLGTPALDIAIANLASGGRAYPRFWLALTDWGGGEIRALVGLLAAAFLWWRKRSRDAIILLSVALVQTGANSLLKLLFARARPDLYPHLDRVWDLSYPSGHSAQNAALYLLIALLIDRRLLWIAAPVVLLIGVSRIVLGVHWPTDVLGGWLEGAAFALVGYSFSRSLRAKSRSASAD